METIYNQPHVSQRKVAGRFGAVLGCDTPPSDKGEAEANNVFRGGKPMAVVRHAIHHTLNYHKQRTAFYVENNKKKELVYFYHCTARYDRKTEPKLCVSYIGYGEN